MADTTSPTTTRGSAAPTSRSISYPADSLSSGSYTKLTFYKYQRTVGGRIGSNIDGTTTITQTINVPLPININDQTNIQTSDFDSPILQNAANFAMAGHDANLLGAALGVVRGTANHIVRSIAPIIGHRVGTIINPHTSLLFNGVGLKSQFLEWRFSPRSQNEARLLQQLYRDIKSHSLPAASTDRTTLDYPDMVTVSYEGVKMAPFINFSFIENVTMTGFPNGPSLYHDGQPVEVALNIQVKELDIRTRETANATRPFTTGTSSDVAEELPLEWWLNEF